MAHTPSPVCLNSQPPCPSIAPRNTSSWAARAGRMPFASASHRRVEPSTSVNRNVTTPEGAGTPAQCHNRYAATLHIAGIGAVTGYASCETGFRESSDVVFFETRNAMRVDQRGHALAAKAIGRLPTSTFFRAAKIAKWRLW